MTQFNVGDVIVAAERVWSKDLGKAIPKGTKIKIESIDDFLLLPEPKKWQKNG